MITGIVTRLAVERCSERLFFETIEGENWLTDALKLSKITSIPSVENLHVKPSFWFILIDKTIRSEFEKAILETFSGGTTVPIQLILTDGWLDSSDSLLANPDAQKCDLQIRLDYDDLLHESFVDEMQRFARRLDENRCLISPSYGVSRELFPCRLAKIRKRLPPFLAIYRTERFRGLSIFTFNHDEWPEELICEFITDPLWMQVVTGKNISNRFGRGWMVTSLRHLKCINLKSWTGDSMELTNSQRFIRLRNILELILDLRLLLRRSFRSQNNSATQNEIATKGSTNWSRE